MFHHGFQGLVIVVEIESSVEDFILILHQRFFCHFPFCDDKLHMEKQENMNL
jgi:hypothetical protein